MGALVPCKLSLLSFPVLLPRSPSFLTLCPECFPSLCRDRVSLSRCMLCGPLPYARGSPALRVLWVRPTSYGSSRETCVARACLAVTGPACGLYQKPQDLSSPRRFPCLRSVGLNPGRVSIDLPCRVYVGAAFPFGGQDEPLRPRSMSGLCSAVRKLAPARRLPVYASPTGWPPLRQDSVLPGVDMTSDVKGWVEMRSPFSSFLLFSW